jgi:competence protein ComEC
MAKVAFAVFWLALGFLSGLSRVALPANEARQTFWRLPVERDRSDRVEGVLADFWVGQPPRAHNRLRAEKLWVDGQWRPFRAEVLLFVSGEEPVVHIADRGDRVVAVGHLTAEGPPVSERDVPVPWPVYRLSVKSGMRLGRQGGSWLSVVTWINRWLFDKLPAPGSRGAAFDRDVRGPLAALLLGRTSEVDRGMVARYRRGGLYHLLVVSGLHVALAAGLMLSALRIASVTGRARDLLLLLGILLFVLIGGGNPPAVRAGLVFGTYIAARWLERPVPAMQAIGLSAILLCLAAPLQIWSVGTVLTFAAVTGIASFGQSIRSWFPRRPGSLFAGFSAAIAAQVATAPILLWRFNVMSAGAWLTAPLSVPLAAGLIACGAIWLAGIAVGFYLSPLAWLFALGSRILEWLAERAVGVAYLRPTPPLWLVVSVCALTIVAGLSASKRGRRAAGAAAAAVFLLVALRPGPAGPARGLSVEALDVGQGDALLLRWRRHAVLIDGGGTFDLEARDFGRTRLLPKLLDRGVTELDAAILTHPHPDHALGLFAVMEELRVGAFWRSTGDDENDFFRELDALAASRKVPSRPLLQGSFVQWRDAKLSVIHSGGLRHKTDAINNQSLVLLIERDGRRALLTGDAGAAAESELLRGSLAHADLLKVGHHGSRSSTTRAFAAAVAPRLALLSCGRENRFGHPAAETLTTLRTLQVPVFRTDLLCDVRADLLPGYTRLAWRGWP